MSNPFRHKTRIVEAPVRESALASRDAFVREVAATVVRRHGGGTESFVFGLSGRWGEGKTFFLEQLRTELEKQGFEVVDLNPWKYAADRVAFLRSFLLKLLDTQTRSGRVASAWRALLAGGGLSRRVSRAWAALDLFGAATRRRLRVDVSRQSISWFRLLLLALVFYWLLTMLSASIGADAQPWLKWLAAVPAGLAIWLVQGLVGSQVSTKAATALDDFDAITSIALGAHDGQPPTRKVVVLVDDLDRVTARVARDVLDNLRTFFDKPALSFVVTGDHEVLEANLGAELASRDATPEVQRELGRLFLKKIFNVYWRLPLPVPSEFESFVNAQMASAQVELEMLIPSQESRQRLRDWLLRYTGYNLRQVERMLDTILFSLRLVKAQLEAASEPQQQRVLTQMAEEPLLLARVLFIQERCAPFFELLTVNAELLYDLDVVVHEARVKGGADAREAVSEFLTNLQKPVDGTRPWRLTDPQRTFLTDFIYEQPPFHDPARGGKYVPGLAPWIHLACDAGLRDSAGPRAEDMLRTIENQNRESLAAQLATCSPTRAEEVAPRVVEGLLRDGDVGRRTDRILLVLDELASASPGVPLVGAVTDAMRERLDRLLAGTSNDQRIRLLLALDTVLHAQGFEEIPEDIQDHFAFRGFGDFQHIERSAMNPLQSLVVIGWLESAYAQNQANALPAVEEISPHLSIEGASLEAMGVLTRRIREDLLADVDVRRTTRLQLLTEYGRAELPALSDEVLRRVLEEGVWRWAVSVAEIAPWTVAQLQDALLDAIESVAENSQELLRLATYALGKLEDRAADLWNRTERARADALLGVVESLAGRPALAALPLPQDVATRLYKQLAREVFELAQQDETAAIGRARLLDPDIWLWAGADKHSMSKALGPLADGRRRFAQVRTVARPFRDSLDQG